MEKSFNFYNAYSSPTESDILEYMVFHPIKTSMKAVVYYSFELLEFSKKLNIREYKSKKLL